MTGRRLSVSIDASADPCVDGKRIGWGIDSLEGQDAIQTLLSQRRNHCSNHAVRLRKHEPTPKLRQSGFHAGHQRRVEGVIGRSRDVHDSILASAGPPSTAEWEEIEDVLFSPNGGGASDQLSNYLQ